VVEKALLRVTDLPFGVALFAIGRKPRRIGARWAASILTAGQYVVASEAVRRLIVAMGLS
jgi:hypothetical protein